MSTRLYFPIKDLKQIVAHSKEHPEFSPGFAHLSDAAYLKTGEVIGSGGYANAAQIDLTKIPAHFCLVHDQGVYLMAGTTRTLPKPDGGEGSLVVYADGIDPNKDSDWWEAGRDAVGGDDFAEHLPLEWLDGIEDLPDHYFYVLEVALDTIRPRAPVSRVPR